MEENMDTIHEGDFDKKWMGLWEEHVAWTRLTIISLWTSKTQQRLSQLKIGY
jgi:hypothetical protein